MRLGNLENLSAKGILILCLLGLLVTFGIQFCSPVYGAFSNGIQDFTNMYIGALLVGTPDLYNAEVNLSIQNRIAITGPDDNRPFVRLPFFALILKPLRDLSYVGAVRVWKLILVMAFCAFAFFFREAPRKLVLLALCWSSPALNAFLLGQDTPLILVWLALSLFLRSNGMPFLAGLVLVLCAAKFHIFILLPLLFFARREWTMAAGFAAGSLMLAASCFLIQGPNFLAQYWAAVNTQTMHGSPWLSPNLTGIFWIFRRPEIPLILSLVVVVCTYAIFRKYDFEVGFAASIIGGLTIATHGYVHDWTLAIPALLLIYMKVPSMRREVLLLGSPILTCWPIFVMAPVLVTWLACIWIVAFAWRILYCLGFTPQKDPITAPVYA